MMEITPTQLENLRQQRLIAEQNDRAVWLMQGPDGQPFAQKTLQTPLLALRARTLFVQRLNVVLRIQHPHLLPVYAGRVRKTSQCVVVMEYAPRGSLYDAVAAGEQRFWTLPLAPTEAGRMVREIAAGVQSLHAHDVLHGGLKLTNVLLVATGDGVLHAKVGDALLHQGITGVPARQGRVPLGSLIDPTLYLAPEQYGQRPTLASDQYALSVIAFLLLTGEAPFAQSPLAMLQASDIAAPRHASALNPVLPQAVDAVLSRGLQRPPKARYATIQAFADDLGKSLAQRDLARSIHLPSGSIPITRATGERRKVKQDHEAVLALPPLAVLRNAATPATPSTKMPALPANYAWVADALAHTATSAPTLAPAKANTLHRRGQRASARVLVSALALVALLIIALSVYLGFIAFAH